jgi:glutamate dehydrogenase
MLVHRIHGAIIKHHEIAALAYQDFNQRFNPNFKGKLDDSLNKKLSKIIYDTIPIDLDRDILNTYLIFNRSILKTNFYKTEKTSLSFRLNSNFLEKTAYPEAPYGIFFICAKEFYGFHIRFSDIARGGIRIVRSRDEESYENNSDFIFDENYDLAFTQSKKNKDIPEGGSKGTILLRLQYQDCPDIAFKKYIDGLLDLIVKDSEIKDFYKKEELLFLGPDEGTAHLMDWASLKAKDRNYKYWRSFTTGKSPTIGGIPHDEHGMTTIGVHQYVLGILNKVNLDESKITKIQTGGPDGDLGGNEIKFSRDKTIAIIDGSGVLYDPSGIDRKELLRLVKSKKMVEHFDKKLISKDGFLITINDHNVKLPDQTLVESGQEFRNTFHLTKYAKADLFVPCGGRPRSINISNWKNVMSKNGKSPFKFIVEGANLFITQDARIKLEETGVILIKDASANKGGVTSSSLEVLVGLALPNDEYKNLICTNEGRIPEFRKIYIQEVIDRIIDNARNEFELLWRENKSKKIPMCILTDKISDKINNTQNLIMNSDLVSDKNLVRKILKKYIPNILISKIGLDIIIKTIPKNYIDAIFASKLASDYVYKYGLDANEIDFINFLKNNK